MVPDDCPLTDAASMVAAARSSSADCRPIVSAWSRSSPAWRSIVGEVVPHRIDTGGWSRHTRCATPSRQSSHRNMEDTMRNVRLLRTFGYIASLALLVALAAPDAATSVDGGVAFAQD